MTPSKATADPVLRRTAIGFSILITLCWVVEFLQIPHRFFGEAAGFIWFRVLFRTATLIGVWIWVHVTSKRLLKRLHYLEEFLLMCGWCRKIGHQGRWLSTEEYFGSKFETLTSHGICPECSAEHFDDMIATVDAMKASRLANGLDAEESARLKAPAARN
jgi:hypothetical protein